MDPELGTSRSYLLHISPYFKVFIKIRGKLLHIWGSVTLNCPAQISSRFCVKSTKYKTNQETLAI